MSTLENDVSGLVLSMFDEVRILDVADERLLAFWATKIAVLLDAAQPRLLVPRGFGHDLESNDSRPPWREFGWEHSSNIKRHVGMAPTDLLWLRGARRE